MKSEQIPEENTGRGCCSISCDKCDAMQQIFESKMFPVIRDFSKFVKIINEEISDMNACMNNTVNTVNMLIDQLEHNKASLLNAEEEIKNLKSDIQQIKKNNNESINQIQTKSVSSVINDNSNNSSQNVDLDSIKCEINNLKKSFKEYQNMQHDTNCLKFEVKKLKTCIMDDTFSTNNIIQKNMAINDEINQTKETISLKTLTNELDSLNDELRNIKENYASQDTIKKIKKQLRKLSNRVDTIENKKEGEIKMNNDSEEESINMKENKEENENIFNSIRNLDLRVTTLELETKKINDTINKPKVQQIFVDLPNSKACNLLFRSPVPQNAKSNV